MCICVHACPVNSVILDSLHAYIENGWASQVVLAVKNPPANSGEVKDMGSIPGSRRSLEEGMATHSSMLAWRIPWIKEPGRFQSTG